MGKVILTQDEIPFPDDYLGGNKVVKFRYRVINSNRNQSSDWSVINYAEQDIIKNPATQPIPPGGSIGQVPAKVSEQDYDIGWSSITSLIPNGTYAPNTPTGGGDYVSTNSNVILPIGGSINQVLTKLSSNNYDVNWQDAPTSSPDEMNFSIGVSLFA